MSDKTKDAIVSAFLDLASKEKFDKITVTDLAEYCNISRQTFYYHFNDIEEMIEWTFRNETKKICTVEEDKNWSEYSAMYTALFNKYDRFFKESLRSANFILIYNLINKSFYDYLNFYLEKRSSGMSLGKNKDFFVACLAGAFSSLMIKEIQKERSNYQEVFESIRAAMQGVAL